MIQDHREDLVTYGHASSGSKHSTHGIRKGAATYAAGGSTAAPGIVAICLRADWSFGSTLSRYLFLEGAQDQYCGRMVAGLPVHSHEFAALPPHFEDSSHADVISATKEQFSQLWEAYPHFRGNLLLCTASLVYHRSILLADRTMGSDARAQLAGTPLFLDVERLCRLAEIVTVEQTSLRATGLPPHTKMLQQQNETQQQLRGIAQQIKEFAQTAVTDIVRGVMENVELDAAGRGIITATALEIALSRHTKAMLDSVKEMVSHVAVTPAAGASLPTGGSASSCTTYKTFQHDVDRRHPTTNGSPRMFPCPEDFTMPCSSTIMLRPAFMLWLKGDVAMGVQPFRQLTTDSFGPNASKIKALHEVNIIVAYPEYAKRMKKNQESLTIWRRIMLVLESALLPDTITPNMSMVQVIEAYDMALQHLKKSYMAFAFASPRHKFGLQTWSKYAKPSYIARFGTASDCKNLAKRRQDSGKYTSTVEEEITKTLASGTPLAKRAKS